MNKMAKAVVNRKLTGGMQENYKTIKGLDTP